MVSASSSSVAEPTDANKKVTKSAGNASAVATATNGHLHDAMDKTEGKNDIQIVRILDPKTRDILVPVPKTENITDLAVNGTIPSEFIEHPKERFHFTGCDAPRPALANPAYFDCLGDIVRGFNDEFRAELSVTGPIQENVVPGAWPTAEQLADPESFPLGLHIRPPVADDRNDTETIREANLSAIVQHFTVVLHNTFFKRGAHLQELTRFYKQADPGLLRAAFGVISKAGDFTNPISYHFAPAVQAPELMLVSTLQILIVQLWKKMDLYDLDLKLWIAFPNTIGTLQAHALALLERLQNQTSRAVNTSALFKIIDGRNIEFEQATGSSTVRYKLYPLMFPRLVMYILFYNLGNNAYPNKERQRPLSDPSTRKRPEVPKAVTKTKSKAKKVRLRVSAQDSKLVTIKNSSMEKPDITTVRAPASSEGETENEYYVDGFALKPKRVELTLYNQGVTFPGVDEFDSDEIYIV